MRVEANHTLNARLFGARSPDSPPEPHPCPPAPRKSGHLSEANAAVAKIKSDEAARGAKFQAQVDREKSSKDILNKKFDELLKQAKDDPDKGKPFKPLGFD